MAKPLVHFRGGDPEFFVTFDSTCDDDATPLLFHISVANPLGPWTRLDLADVDVTSILVQRFFMYETRCKLQEVIGLWSWLC